MQDRWLPFPRTGQEVEVMGWNVTTASAIKVQKAKPLHGRVASRSPVELCWGLPCISIAHRVRLGLFCRICWCEQNTRCCPRRGAATLSGPCDASESRVLGGKSCIGWDHNWLYGPKFALDLPGCSSILPGLPRLEKLHSRLYEDSHKGRVPQAGLLRPPVGPCLLSGSLQSKLGEMTPTHHLLAVRISTAQVLWTWLK